MRRTEFGTWPHLRAYVVISCDLYRWVQPSGTSVTLDTSVDIWATDVLATYTYICTDTHRETQTCLLICLLSSLPVTDLSIISSVRAESSPVEQQLLARCLADNRELDQYFPNKRTDMGFFHS